jgi:hypothetical protein
MMVPDELVDLLTGSPELDARGQAFPFLTVDDNGFPHAALLSRAEVEVGPERADLRAALRSRQTRANLTRSGRATLIAVREETAHYLKMRLVRSTVAHDLMACVFEVAEHKADSLGIPLTPLSYPVRAEIARAERWDLTAAALRLLR